MDKIYKDGQYKKFCLYGFLKSMRFFEAFFILYLIQKGLSYTQIGLLYALREISINLMEVPSGILADTFGRKRAMIGSFFVYILSFILYYLANSMWLMAPAFILYGAAEAFRSGTHKGMMMSYLEKKGWSHLRIDYYGHTRAWSQTGLALSALVAGSLVYFSGSYETIFLFSIIPYVLNILLVASYPQELNGQTGKGNKRSINNTLKALWISIKNPRLLSVINTSALHSAYLKSIKDYIQPLIVQLALVVPLFTGMEANKKNGVFVAVFYFLIYFMNAAASRRAQKIEGRRPGAAQRTLMIGLSAGAACGVLYAIGLWAAAILCFMCIFIMENIRKPILTAYVADRVEPDVLTSVLSAQSLLKTVFTAGISLILGVMADALGLGAALLGVSCICLLIYILVDLTAYYLRRQK